MLSGDDGLAKTSYILNIHRWLFVLVLFASGSLYAEELPEISLDVIQEYAAVEYSKTDMMNESVVLGIHNGATVVVDYPCIDICPDYTVQIIRYEVSLAECAGVGGTIISTFIPWAMGKIVHEYCSPLDTP